MRTILILIFVAVALNVAHAASNDEELERLRELDAKCEKAREEKLKPLREAKIKECVENDGKERVWCERYFKDYGWGSVTAMGTRNERHFDQIPECVEAFDAWHSRER
jgi:hypothetical protein